MSALRMFKAFAVVIQGTWPGDVVNIFHDLIPRWFAALPVYSYSEFAVHPPATYAILWPLFGFLESGPARWLWIALLIIALAWLVYLVVRHSGAETLQERIF